MKVLIHDHPSMAKAIKKKLLENGIEEVNVVWKDTEKFKELIKDVEVVITEFASRDILKNGNLLKLIHSSYRGINGIDLQAAKEFGLIVCNTSSNIVATAEHTFALMLSCAKEIVISDRKFRNDKWEYGYWSDHYSTLLKGKKLAIIGLGSIGLALAKRALAFDMEVFGIRRSGEQIPGIKVYKPNELNVVLKSADFVIVTLPLTKNTIGFIGNTEFEEMKNSAIFVNISRGKIVDQEALFNALKEKKIAYAGIDVWYNYPKERINLSKEKQSPSDFPFRELENVVMTPHRGGFVKESAIKAVNQVVENVLNYKEGKKLNNIINLELGY
ncbi:MAG: 2-hydroxyacid dehydrogenase [Candidatus Ranarchaeia archaeon]